MSIRFPTEAANADVMGEDPDLPSGDGQPAAAATQLKRDHQVSREERAAGDLRGARTRPRKDAGAPGLIRGREDDKP